MSLLVACPVILPPRPSVIESWDHRPHLIVDNTPTPDSRWRKVGNTASPPILGIDYDPPRNGGVAHAWNMAFAVARDARISHVALVSQGLTLTRGTSWLADLVDEHADWRGLLTDFAWHCIVLSVELWEQVGPFDERFHPAYYEDNDYVRRLEIAGLHTASNPIPKVDIGLLGGREVTAAALLSGVVSPDIYGLNGRRYAEKWGGPPGDETLIDPKEPL